MEETIVHIVSIIKLSIEVISVAFVVIGTVLAVFCYMRAMLGKMEKDFVYIRLIFARYLVLALEFQLAADILSTAISPSWEAIGKLAAITVIRTVLNYFLTKEMEKEREEVKALYEG